MFSRTDIAEGMFVKDLTGEKLGKVKAVSADSFLIEKGYFFVKDYLVRYSDIRDVRNGEVTLLIGKEGLTTGRTTAEAASTSDAAKVTPIAGAKEAIGERVERAKAKVEAAKEKLLERRMAGAWNEEVRIPLYHEELEWSKNEQPAGEVHIHKGVVEEKRTIAVPLRHEHVRVEHRPLSKDTPAGAMAFREETVVMPLRAEDAELRKRRVADEEVVIHKDAVEEKRTYSGTVMRETVDIEEEGTLRAARTDPSLDTLKRT